jgi:hypothetical protein
LSPLGVTTLTTLGREYLSRNCRGVSLSSDDEVADLLTPLSLWCEACSRLEEYLTDSCTGQCWLGGSRDCSLPLADELLLLLRVLLTLLVSEISDDISDRSDCSSSLSNNNLR